jgi:DNA-binding NtrC family response regulator
LEIYRKHKDDITVVLLDLTMPHMDGTEAFTELRRINPDVKVILSSGYNESDTVNRFAGKGLAGFIQKPYRLNTLADKLKEVLSPK